VIPDSVTSIGVSAFNGCNSALYTEYECGTYVGDGENPYAVLISLTNPSLKTYTIHEDTRIIAYGVFSSCEQLSSIEIPDSVTSISDYAFYSCDSLTSIVIPDSVTSIGDYAFYSCDSLTSVYITDIASWCNIEFSDYSANPLFSANDLYLNGELVTDLVIPNSVTSIGDWAFYSCDSLTIVIPDSVMSIGDGAFFACNNLTSVYYGGTAAEWSEIEIDSDGNSCLTNATRYYYSEEAPTTEGNFWHYDNDGKVVVWFEKSYEEWQDPEWIPPVK
jgi:hypothetical protein